MMQELKKDIQILNGSMRVLKNKYHVKQIGIFGSVARGDARKSSDVDVLVEFERPVGFFAFLELEEYLTIMLGKKVDLVTKQSLKPLLKQTILKQVQYV